MKKKIVSLVLVAFISTSIISATGYKIDHNKGYFDYGVQYLGFTHYRQYSQVDHKTKYHRASVIVRYCPDNFNINYKEYAYKNKIAWTSSKYATCLKVRNSYYWYQV
ncbi:MAG: hypothetical protein LBR40_03100 [Bacilli bacterium]|jgi:hypothetical protein|nr:hypothetical protein [Bacilli bacterium]